MTDVTPILKDNKVCSVDGCNKPAHSAALCSAHGHRLSKHGWAHASTRPTEAQLLWRYIRRAPSGCWDWTGRLSPQGYGVAGRNQGGTRKAHRRVYELIVGPIPDGLDLDHTCFNRGCVNPSHLEPVTRAENVRRSAPNMRRTHCRRGHALDEANTYVFSSGKRQCLICKRVGERAWRERQKEAP